MKKYFPLFLILLLGVALRFYHNLDISMWHDEAFSALMVRHPWHEMFVRLGLDVHPPAYYAVLRVAEDGASLDCLQRHIVTCLLGINKKHLPTS